MSIKDAVNNFYSKAVNNISNKNFFVASYSPSVGTYSSKGCSPQHDKNDCIFSLLEKESDVKKIFLNVDDISKIKGFKDAGKVIGLSKKLLEHLDNGHHDITFFAGIFYEENILDFGFDKNTFQILDYSNEIKNLAKNLRGQLKNSRKEGDTPAFFSQDYFVKDFNGTKTDLNHILNNLNGKEIVWSLAESKYDIKSNFSYFDKLEQMAESLGKSIKDKYILLRVTPCLWKGCSKKLPFNENLFNDGKFFDDIKKEYNDSVSNAVIYKDWRADSIDEDKLKALGKLIGQDHIIFKFYEKLLENRNFWTGKVKPSNIAQVKLSETTEFADGLERYEEFDLVDQILGYSQVSPRCAKMIKMVDFYYENHPEEKL